MSLTIEDAIENIQKAVQEYFDAANMSNGVITDSVVISAQQVYSEDGSSGTNVHTLPLGLIPGYRIMGLLGYAKAAYESSLLSMHVGPPVIVQQMLMPPYEADDEDGEL